MDGGLLAARAPHPMRVAPNMPWPRDVLKVADLAKRMPSLNTSSLATTTTTPVPTHIIGFASQRQAHLLDCWLRFMAKMMESDPDVEYRIEVLRPAGSDCAGNVSSPQTKHVARVSALAAKVVAMHVRLRELAAAASPSISPARVLFADLDVMPIKP